MNAGMTARRSEGMCRLSRELLIRLRVGPMTTTAAEEALAMVLASSRSTVARMRSGLS